MKINNVSDFIYIIKRIILLREIYFRWKDNWFAKKKEKYSIFISNISIMLSTHL